MTGESEASLKGARVSGSREFKRKKTALITCANPKGCQFTGLGTLKYIFTSRGQPDNYRITANLLGRDTAKDPFRCILFTREGQEHPEPGMQWPQKAAICGMKVIDLK
jgi:hypothetical protein